MVQDYFARRPEDSVVRTRTTSDSFSVRHPHSTPQDTLPLSDYVAAGALDDCEAGKRML